MKVKANSGRHFASFFLDEPELVFGESDRHVDPKMGLTLFGPAIFSENQFPLPSSINVGIIGTDETIALAEDWLKKCQQGVPGSDESRDLVPPFPGFSKVFGCRLVVFEGWKEILTVQEIDTAIRTEYFGHRVRRAARLFVEKLQNLSEREPAPDVVICALPQKILDYCGSKRGDPRHRARLTGQERELLRVIEENRLTGQQTLFPFSENELGLDFLPQASNFRRILKGEAMSTGLPTQLARPSTFTGQDKGRPIMQHEATRAWNFCVALYYKGGGYPWRMADAPAGTCYVGISFYKDPHITQRGIGTSMAQVFTHTGEGLVLRGARAEWDEVTRSPHMSRDGALKLLSDAMKLYDRQMHQKPQRIVVHKTSRFWPEELEGFLKAANDVHQHDFVSIADPSRGIRFMRKGKYPPLRGSVIKLSEDNALVYTTGYVPFLKTYPGPRIPRPLEILEHEGDSSIPRISREILALSKMNWNTADFSSSLPITVAFAREVGKILAEVPEGKDPQTQYRYYM